MKYTIPTLAALGLTFLCSCGDEPHTEHSKHAEHNHVEDVHHDHEDHEHEGHDHSSCDGDHSGHEHIKAGPNKGRMIFSVTPQAEFLVIDGGKVKVTFFDESMNVVAPSGQSVSVVSGERTSPVELNFTAQGDSLVSTEALPSGNNFPTVVTIKATSDSEEVITKFTLNLSECSSCENQEYSCECHH